MDQRRRCLGSRLMGRPPPAPRGHGSAAHAGAQLSLVARLERSGAKPGAACEKARLARVPLRSTRATWRRERGPRRLARSSNGRYIPLVTSGGTNWDPARERRQRLTGIALMCGAVACFSVLDTGAKYLSTHMDVLQVVWVRYTAAFLLTLAISNPIRTPRLMATSRPLLQVGRAVLLLGSTSSNFLALQYLQLDQALAITFSAPFLVAVLSGPLLGEWVGWRRWTAIGVGFVGVLLVTRPGFGGIHPAALLCLVNALCLALYGICTRILTRTDSNQTTLFYSNAVGAALGCRSCPWCGAIRAISA